VHVRLDSDWQQGRQEGQEEEMEGDE
jgi:hypothetical protein